MSQKDREFEQWLKDQHEERDEHHGDGERRKKGVTSPVNLGILNSIRQSNLDRLRNEGVGYSKNKHSKKEKE